MIVPQPPLKSTIFTPRALPYYLWWQGHTTICNCDILLTTPSQKAMDSLLYYTRDLENTILPVLNEISTQQSKPAEIKLKTYKRLLDYVSTYKCTFLRYHASSMILSVDSDAAYLVAQGAKKSYSRGFLF